MKMYYYVRNYHNLCDKSCLIDGFFFLFDWFMMGRVLVTFKVENHNSIRTYYYIT